MRPAFKGAISRLAERLALESSASADLAHIVRDAVRALSPAQRTEIANANELTFQKALSRAMQGAST